MTEPVTIGIKEVYDKVVSLADKLDKHSVDMAVRVALLERESSKRWQVNLALVAAGLSFIGSVAMALFRYA